MGQKATMSSSCLGATIFSQYLVNLVYTAGSSRHMGSRTYSQVFMGNMFWRYLFQQYITPTEGSQISAYDLPVTGAAYNDKLASQHRQGPIRQQAN